MEGEQNMCTAAYVLYWDDAARDYCRGLCCCSHVFCYLGCLLGSSQGFLLHGGFIGLQAEFPAQYMVEKVCIEVIVVHAHFDVVLNVDGGRCASSARGPCRLQEDLTDDDWDQKFEHGAPNVEGKWWEWLTACSTCTSRSTWKLESMFVIFNLWGCCCANVVSKHVLVDKDLSSGGDTQNPSSSVGTGAIQLGCYYCVTY